MTERATLALLLATLALPATATEIDHAAIGCVVADVFPRFEARLTPPDSVARARVHFRPAKGRHWYSVAMKVEGGVFAAVLPKPKKKLEGLSYYIEAIAADTTPTRTAEFSAVVAAGPVACQDKKVASSVASASVVLEVPAGAPAVPAGFSGSGLSAAAVGTVAGVAAGAGAAAAAAGGGGAATALLVGGGVVVAAGAAAAVVVTGGGEGDGGNGGNGGGGVTIYDLIYNPFLDISVCVGRELRLTGPPLHPDAEGNFDDPLSGRAGENPEYGNIRGRVTDTTFTATLACGNPALGSTSFSASGSGGSFAGSFTFDGRAVGYTVTRRPPNQ